MMARFVALSVLLAYCRLAESSSNIPNTSLNLPIDEAIGKDSSHVRISDSYKDNALVEPTLREMRIKNFIHSTIINIARPVPIVDTIKEEEKYGNTGNPRINAAGDAVVRATEVGTQFLGRLVSLPINSVTTISGRITQSLNRVGAAIIGL